jgi:hypothetical protein
MKNITLTSLAIFILTLTACGSAANGTTPASVPQSGAPAGELPATTQLILGTFKLDETENAVTAEQAAELLPLWQTLQVLSESDTAADQEMEALTTQVQETMTAEQMQAITDMNLTREDMFTVMQEQGLTMGVGGPAGGQNNSQGGNSSNNGGAARPGGDEFPGGVPPQGEFSGGGPGGFGGGQGQNLSPEQIATAQAARQAGGGNMTPSPLINALIAFLEQKAGS